MSQINITWTSDENDCETCGRYYAEGAIVTIDGVPFGDFEAVAHCYDSQTFSQQQVYAAILVGLGHSLVEDTEPHVSPDYSEEDDDE